MNFHAKLVSNTGKKPDFLLIYFLGDPSVTAFAALPVAEDLAGLIPRTVAYEPSRISFAAAWAEQTGPFRSRATSLRWVRHDYHPDLPCCRSAADRRRRPVLVAL